MKKIIVPAIIIICVWLISQYPKEMLNPGQLVNGHQQISEKCNSCHTPFWGIANNKCMSCHKLSEIEKDALHEVTGSNPKISFHQYLTNQKCTSCHTDHKGKKPDMPLSIFSHNLLSQTYISNCNSCHNKPTDTIHKLISSVCNNCHNTNGWKSFINFDHNMIQAVDKNNCLSCHQKPNDLYHISNNNNCMSCHTTIKWVPSTFNHSSYFKLDQNHNANCNTCHTNNNFTTYSCYGCHEHSESGITEKHTEEGIYNFTNCASCHKSSNEHDIEINKNDKNKEQDDDHYP